MRWIGHQDDVGPLLQAADVLALPSFAEGMNGSIIEAMAAGLPVIASDIAANRYLVTPNETGLLAGTEDLDAWTSAIRQLRRGSLRSELGNQARQRFESEFTLEGSAQGMVALYRDVIAAQRRR